MESTSRSRAPVALLAASGAACTALLLGSCRTPQTLCDEYINNINATGAACGGRDDYYIRDPMNPLRTGCGIVSSVSEPAEIVNDCIPFLIQLGDACAAADIPPDWNEYVAEYPENLPAFCASGHFEVLR